MKKRPTQSQHFEREQCEAGVSAPSSGWLKSHCCCSVQEYWVTLFGVGIIKTLFIIPTLLVFLIEKFDFVEIAGIMNFLSWYFDGPFLLFCICWYF